MKIIRDKNGNLINIGEWDTEDGLHPIPEGATKHDEKVVTGYDGGLYLANDPRRLQP
jgi:hypothetical protein